MNIDQVAVELVSHTKLSDRVHRLKPNEKSTGGSDTRVYKEGSTAIEHDLWRPYGHPRGGTPALLLETPYGKRYLTFFHSEAKYMTSWCLTYFMGAYLFEADPPFRITHFSPHPIIPNPVYNQTNKWAFQNIDYIAFPMGFYYTDDYIYLCMGRNDREGWIVVMKRNNFLLSLHEYSSEVHANNFWSVFT